MKHFFIITNQIKDPQLETTEWITDYLTKRGIGCQVHVQEDCQGQYYTDSRMIPAQLSSQYWVTKLFQELSSYMLM